MKEGKSTTLIVIAIIAAMGGLLFGFDAGAISGAIPYFQKQFHLGNNWVGIITTAALAGAVIGALFSGRITDKLGRKKVILSSAVIFILSALWSALAPDRGNLVVARFSIGIAIGVLSFAVPLYIAEISPAKSRGILVTLFQLLIAAGIMISYFSDLAFALPEGARGYLNCWRPMFFVEVIPALIMFTGILFLPETPRWLIFKGFEDKSRKVLLKIEGEGFREETLSRMKRDIEADRQNSTSWREIFRPWLRKPLAIAIGIMMIQQFIGINTIIYYSPKIFLMAGFGGAKSAIMASTSVGVVSVLFTLVSMFLVDNLGRRKLYFGGVSGMVVTLILLGFCFAFRSGLGGSAQTLAVALILIYMAFFSVSLGPLGWLIISEVFPLKVRGVGASIGSLSNWLFNGIVAFTFFKIVKLFTVSGSAIVLNNKNIGNPAGAFWLYAIIGIAGLLWGYFYIPETKGKSLETIEKHWKEGKMPKEL